MSPYIGKSQSVASFGGPGGGVAPPKEQLAPPKAAAGGLGGGELGGKPWPLGDPHGLTPGQKLSEQIYVGR